MNKIEVLDKNTIDKIAAGEVVERPASVAKELIENAVDSKANAVTIEIKGGGIEFIRVTDNGCGIYPDQIRAAFLRHATSKLRNIEDLSSISSLGFRGEALCSIAAVSRVELITRQGESVTGVRYLIEGGIEKSYEEIGAPYGTTFIMRNLFFNTPVRAKFLKSALSEQNAITSFAEQLALSNPNISFKYIVNGGIKFYTSGNGNLKEAVYQIYGKEAAKQLIEIFKAKENVEVSGFLGRAEAARGSRSFEIYFVNGRYVKDKIISKAIEDGYEGNLMQRRYPFTILNFKIDKEKVDVNVHPAKLEIRLSNQREICNEIAEIVRVKLLENQSVPEMDFQAPSKKTVLPDPASYEKGIIFGGGKTADARDLEEPSYSKPDNKDAKAQKPGKRNSSGKRTIPEPFEYKRREAAKTIPELVAERQISLFENDKLGPKRSARIIGQLFDTYILIESEEKFYIIDQHAAHEKIIYERLKKRAAKGDPLSQMLMPPAILSLSIREADTLRANIGVFRQYGFEIEEFGGRQFKVTGVPADIYNIDTDELFTEILSDPDALFPRELRLISERIALKSCKAAVKGNSRLSKMEIQELIDELFALDDPYHCPHGRPVIISFSHYEIDRKFKRIV